MLPIWLRAAMRGCRQAAPLPAARARTRSRLRIAHRRALLSRKKEVELRETQHNIAPVAARKSILLLSGRAEAGRNFNVTPDFCSFTIDRRINPEEDLEEEKRRLRGTLEGFEMEMIPEEPQRRLRRKVPLE